MRVRDLERAVCEIVDEFLGDDNYKVTAKVMPDVEAVGVQGDERHVGKVVILDIGDGEWTAEVAQHLLDKISKAATGRIREVGRVVYDTSRIRPTEEILAWQVICEYLVRGMTRRFITSGEFTTAGERYDYHTMSSSVVEQSLALAVQTTKGLAEPTLVEVSLEKIRRPL